MGKKDIQAHEFLANNARFADLCNYFLFDGREIIAPDELKEQDTTEIFSAFGISKKELHLQKMAGLIKTCGCEINQSLHLHNNRCRKPVGNSLRYAYQKYDL